MKNIRSIIVGIVLIGAIFSGTWIVYSLRGHTFQRQRGASKPAVQKSRIEKVRDILGCVLGGCLQVEAIPDENLDEAIKLLNEEIERSPNSAEAYFLLNRVLNTKAYQVNPFHDPGGEQTQLRLEQQAKEAIKQAYRLDPQDERIWRIYIGDVLPRKEMLKELQKKIQERPTDSSLHSWMGWQLLFKGEDIDVGVRELKQYVEYYDPSQEDEVYFFKSVEGYARVMKEWGRLDDAIEFLEKAATKITTETYQTEISKILSRYKALQADPDRYKKWLKELEKYRKEHEQQKKEEQLKKEGKGAP